MTRRLSIHEMAEAELNEAVDFYDLASHGLGASFIAEVQRSIAVISEFPEASPLIHGLIRRKVLARFPYSLVYSVRPEEIRILAIAHQKRRPFYWRGRR